jgi:molybdopterin-containing oxidoreductase family iron-sulfur binding subunit
VEWPEPLDRQLNPDVSVRPVGVMEKCTFCVQRIQDAKSRAKDEERQVRDGEIETACSQSCPARTIVFGDLHDPDSRVSQLARSARALHLLEDLGTEPSVIYLRGGE